MGKAVLSLMAESCLEGAGANIRCTAHGLAEPDGLGTVTHGKIKRLQPEAAVYTGNKGQQAGEEMALFHHLDCPVKDTRDGMAVLSYRKHWELE